MADAKKDARRATDKAYRERHRERIAADKKAYNALHKERNAARDKAYYEAHKVEKSTTDRARYVRNRSHIILEKEAYRIAHPEQILQTRRASYERHRDQVKARVKRRKRDNPQSVRLHKLRRRARKAALPATLTPGQWTSISERFGDSCALTGSSKISREHAIPLSVGHGGTTLDNIYPLRKDLNSSKSNKHIFEWFENNRERFGLCRRKFDELISYLAEVNEMTTQEYRMYTDWCFDNPNRIEEQ